MQAILFSQSKLFGKWGTFKIFFPPVLLEMKERMKVDAYLAF